MRSANCLKNANIHTLRDLVRKTEKDMLETKNFGRKSLEELQELLGRLGLALRHGRSARRRRGASSVIASARGVATRQRGEKKCVTP